MFCLKRTVGEFNFGNRSSIFGSTGFGRFGFHTNMANLVGVKAFL